MTRYDPIRLCRAILLQFTVKAFFSQNVFFVPNGSVLISR
jgi:hypothetical protein